MLAFAGLRPGGPDRFVGVGAIKTIDDRIAVFGSYHFGTTSGSPDTIALTGFAVAF